MHHLNLKTMGYLQQLKRFEQIWFEIVMPELNALNTAAKEISDKEFEATYSYEQAEKDSNYDARRILEQDHNFLATSEQLFDAKQVTIHAFIIVLGQFVEQTLNDLIRYLKIEEGDHSSIHSEAVKELLKLGIDVTKIENWGEIGKWQNAVNYLKHGKGYSSEKAKDFLEKNLSVQYTSEFDSFIENDQVKQSISSIPYLPLHDRGGAFSEDDLRAYLREVNLFFTELGCRYECC